MKLVLTGGGTGGHVFGGVAIAQEFLSQSKGNDVLFIGSAYGLETRLVPKAGFKLATIKVGRLVGQSRFRQVLTFLQLPLAVLQCMVLLKRFGADAVVGVGGFAAGPCILAARLLGIPTGVLEQNSVAGFTNRVAAKLANQIFLAFEEVPEGFPRHKCIVTGNPARSQLRPKVTKTDEPFTVFAFGGSQGATGINQLMVGMVKKLKADGADVRVIHQTGEKDFEKVVAEYEGLEGVEAHKFIDNMQDMYDRASLIVCRAGSGTISELGATANAAVFVPFPFAAGNHQEVNARAVERAGGARVLLQGKATPDDLVAIVKELRADRQKLMAMRTRMAAFYKADAAHRIVENMKGRALGSPRVYSG